MPTVTLDPATSSRLRELDSLVPLCDADGNLLGHFMPLPHDDESLDPGISVEELDRREAAGGGRPLSEILRDLATRP